jgi:hypothetical protein
MRMVHGSFITRVMPVQAYSGRCLKRVLIQFLAASGDAGCGQRNFARYSLRRLPRVVWQCLESAIIIAGLGGDITSPEHWGCCLGH